MSNYNTTMRNLDLTDKELKGILQCEAQFLPQANVLEAFLKTTKPIEKVTECEALVEIEYLVKICLHHQKWYYRICESLITDGLYDRLEKRIWDLVFEYIGHLIATDNPIRQVGY